MGASGLGALLVKEGFLTEQDRVTITKTCGQGSWAFAKCILATGLLDEDELSAFFAERTKYVVAPKNLLDRLDFGIIEQIDRRMVARLEVLPLEIDHQRITVAVADPLDKSTLKQLEFFTGLEVVPVIAPLSQIHEGLSRLSPEFKPRPTALSNFLRNHAGTAWIKQKIVEDADVDIPQDRLPSRAGLVENYDENSVEDVSLDDDIDGMEDTDDNLRDIKARGLDEGIDGNDFDDIDLDDSGSDLELTHHGEGLDESVKAHASIDDAELDPDDPFHSLDDPPKPKKTRKAAAASTDDDLEDLEAGGDVSDDLWADADEAPARPTTPAKAKAALSTDDELSADGDLSDFGLDDEPVKPAKAKAENDDLSDDLGFDEEPVKPAQAAKANLEDLPDDFGLDDAPATPAQAATVDDDLLGDTPDLDFDDETPKKAEADDFGLDDDLDLGEEKADKLPGTKKAAAEANDELSFDGDELSGDIDSLLDEPASGSGVGDKGLPGFADQKKKGPVESTRMATRPAPSPQIDEDDDLAGVEFADDDETSVSLRKAVHEDGVLPEFTDPNFDEVEEGTSIDLRAASDDELQFSEDAREETDIKLHPIVEINKVEDEPAFDDSDGDQLENLAMGFHDDESIDEPSLAATHDEPGIGDLGADIDLNDIPIEAPEPPVRAGGRTQKPSTDNGSVASLTATAKANEALLRMSLCFDRSSALEIAREYLPQISGTGCLVDIGKNTEALATWRSGAESAVKSKNSATLQRLAKEAKSGQWSLVPISGQDDLFGSVKSISVYKMQKADGRILLLAGDYPIEDESLREALKSFAEQLGAK